MTIEDELGVLRAAYGNAVNDLARSKAQLARAETMLRLFASLLHDKADDLHAGRLDNPGDGGSAGR